MKYMGSKSKITKYIVPIIQNIINKDKIDWYIEPFVGGANVIDKINAPHKIGFDNNKYLIALLQHVQIGDQLPDDISFEEYSAVRSNKDAYEDWYVGCVGFLASYNGRFFDGGYAKPGNGRNYYQESMRNILKQAPNLHDIVFCTLDYLTFPAPPMEKNTLIYCDPPYRGVKQYSTSKGFDSDIFWEWVRNQSKKHTVLVSEQTAPDDFISLWNAPVARTINATNKGSAIEQLFIYRG